MGFNKYLQSGALFILCAVIISCGDPPTQRPGNAFEGSAHWAMQIAQPLINNFAGDAQLYSVQGVQIFSDGRLPANAGSWGMQSWSPSLQKEFQVVVKFDGTTTTHTRDETDPPSANGQPVPSGWVNSTDIFQAVADNTQGNPGVADLAVFNIATYSVPIWGLHFPNASESNHYVNFDGTYIGTEP